MPSYILENPTLEKPKTKAAFDFLKKLQLEDKRVLIIGDSPSGFSNLWKSLRNIKKKYHTFVSKINGYELALCQDLIIMSPAVDGIKELLSKKVGE